MIPATIAASIIIGAVHFGLTLAKNRRISRVVDFSSRTPKGDESREKAMAELKGARTELTVLSIGYPLLIGMYWICIVLWPWLH